MPRPAHVDGSRPCPLAASPTQDCKDQTIKLDNADGCGTLSFKGKAGTSGTDYELDLNLFKEIDVAESKVGGGG